MLKLSLDNWIQEKYADWKWSEVTTVLQYLERTGKCWLILHPEENRNRESRMQWKAECSVTKMFLGVADVTTFFTAQTEKIAVETNYRTITQILKCGTWHSKGQDNIPFYFSED